MRPRVPFKNLAAPVPPFALARDGALLVVVDVHRFTVDPGSGYGLLARERGIARELAEYYEQLAQVVPNAARLVDGCRRRAVPIVFTRLAAAPDGEVTTQARVTGAWTLRTDPAAAFLPALAPREGETVIDKTCLGVFQARGFAEALRASGKPYLLLAGVSANGAVEHTAREAADRGYGVVVVADACAAETWTLHVHVMTTLVGGLIRTRTVTQVLEMLDGTRS